MGSEMCIRDSLYTYTPSGKYLEFVASEKTVIEEQTTAQALESNTTENKISEQKESYFYVDFVMTLEGNRDGYTDRQYECAKRAWKLYLNTGGGGFENFKHYLRQNLIKNNPVTSDDANIAEKIFIKDVAHLKGSSTRKTPDVIDSSKIEIPREIEHQCDDLTLFIDLFFVNGLPMLTCCLLYTSPSPRDLSTSRMPSSA